MSLSTSDSYGSSTDEDIEVGLAQAKIKEFQVRQPHNPMSNQLIHLNFVNSINLQPLEEGAKKDNSTSRRFKNLREADSLSMTQIP